MLKNDPGGLSVQVQSSKKLRKLTPRPFSEQLNTIFDAELTQKGRRPSAAAIFGSVMHQKWCLIALKMVWGLIFESFLMIVLGRKVPRDFCLSIFRILWGTMENFKIALCAYFYLRTFLYFLTLHSVATWARCNSWCRLGSTACPNPPPPPSRAHRCLRK